MVLRVRSLIGLPPTKVDVFSQSFLMVLAVSASLPLVCGVLQGTVLAPVLFTLYSQPLTLCAFCP